MTTQELLLEALKQGKAEGNTRLVNELSKVIKAVYRDASVGREVNAIKKGRTQVKASAADGGNSDWEDYQPGKSKKNTNKAEKVVDAAGDAKGEANDHNFDLSDINAIPIDELATMSKEALLEAAGSLGKIKAYAKAIGLPVNHELKGMDFLEDFATKVNEAAAAIADAN